MEFKMDDLQIEDAPKGTLLVALILNKEQDRIVQYRSFCLKGPYLQARERYQLLSTSKSERVVSWMDKHGGGWYFMSKNPKPDFWHSANPKHIEAAKREHEKARREREKEEEENLEKARQFRTKLKQLMEEYQASIWAVDSDEGMCSEPRVYTSVGGHHELLDSD